MKKCRACEQPKFRECYREDRRYPDGLKPICWACEPKTKLCTACGIEKSKTEGFYAMRGDCKECVSIKSKAHRARRGPEYGRNQKLRRNFNLTPDQFDAILAAQGGVCAICKESSATKRRWHVDHDHVCCPQNGRSCGKCVRGILCHGCNLILGHAKDSAEILSAAINYLGVMSAKSERHGWVRVLV